MECIECKNKMELVSVYDTGSNTDKEGKSYAFNLYLCKCGYIARESVWDNKGVIFIRPNNNVIEVVGNE